MQNYLDSTHYRLGINFEAGRSYVIANRRMLNIGVRYSLTVANPFKKYNYHILFPTEEDRIRLIQQNAVQQVNANTWMANLVMVNIGLGSLPFLARTI